MPLPISPTSPSRASFHTTSSLYNTASNGYFDITPNVPLSTQSHSSSMLGSAGIDGSLTPNPTPSDDYFCASALPTLIADSRDTSERGTELAKKRGIKVDIQGQSKRRRNKPVKAAASNKHNQIEKRYRTNLNDKISALRDSVPSLRAMMDPDEDSGAEESDEDTKQAISGQRRRSIAKVSPLMQSNRKNHRKNLAMLMTYRPRY